MRPPLHLSILFLLLFLPSFSSAQWPPPDKDALMALQAALENPPALSSWTSYAPFCSLPWTSSFTYTCSRDGRITALSVTGNRTKTSDSNGTRNNLSGTFSISALFSALARLPNLTDLSLVSLGIWGALPPEVASLSSLRTLNLSSNYIYGELPQELSGMKSLESLVLSGNLVKGSVAPWVLQGMTALRELDLGNNRLGPDLPVPGPSVVTLILRNNSFKATVPNGFRALAHLESLDLSGNKLFGSVPTYLFSLPAVQHLDLSGNRFTGEIPANATCGRHLGFVDLSDNKLYGKLPPCVVAAAGANASRMYSGNCLTGVRDRSSQRPRTYCGAPEEPLAVYPTPKGNRGSSSSSSSSSSNKGRALVLVAGIAGGIVGAVMVLTLLLLVVFKKAKARERETFDLVKAVSGTAPAKNLPAGHVTDARHMAPEVRLGMLDLMPYRVFTMEEIDEMTNRFDASNLVLDSPPDKIYKGRLMNGSAVTIRSFKLKQKYSPQILHIYMDTISKLRHRHLVSVLGHCIHADEDYASTTTIYIVFEQVTNGTLRSHLTEWRKREMLKWPQRVAAVVGVARGIQFLHTVTSPGIFANDLKMQNIMVNETLTAKISNYCLPRLPKNKNKVTSDVPFSQLEETEANSSVANGDKEDVYQLGLILLEVITGKHAATESELSVLKQQLQCIMSENNPTKLQELTDAAIRGTFAHESLKTAVEITLNCLSQDVRQRPSIDDVLWNLQYSVQVQDACASSDNLSTQS